eukprot:symbB.v1.2.012739.t1/scaffold878.1/size155624/10
MSAMCDDDSFGDLVRAWCPVTCGLCAQETSPSTESKTADNLTLLSEDKALGVSFDNLTKSLNVSNATKFDELRNASEENGTCPAQLGEADNIRSNGSASQKHTTTPSLQEFSEVSPHEMNTMNTTPRGRMHNVSNPERGISTGKAILLLEELEEGGKDTAESLPLIASQFDVLGKDAFSLSFLKMEANESYNGSQNGSIGNKSLVAEILDLLRPAGQDLEEEEEKQCPEGWERLIGDVYGGDQFSGGWRHSANSIDDCAWRCLRQPGCGSFEWSPSQKRCFRNSQTRPTHEINRQDFVFCRRQPCPSFKTKEACVGPGVASGYYSKEVNMRAGSYCIWSAGHCQAPMACTDNDCFLPDGGLPGMELPSRYTLWISRLGLQATMAL